MFRRSSVPALLTSALLLFACTDDDGGSEVTQTETGEDLSDVPTDSDLLRAYLEGESYTDFAAESAVHAPTNGSPHGSVRVFFNDALDSSFALGDTVHPAGSAAIKELYDGDGTTRIGWAVAVKVQADSDGGNGWYWYELLNDNVIADGVGAATCIGCHFASGTDMIATDYPLQ